MTAKTQYYTREDNAEECTEALEKLRQKLTSRRSLDDLHFIPDSYSEADDSMELHGLDKSVCSFSYDVISPRNRRYRAMIRALKNEKVEIRIEFRSLPTVANIYPCLQRIMDFEQYDSMLARLLTELFASEA